MAISEKGTKLVRHFDRLSERDQEVVMKLVRVLYPKPPKSRGDWDCTVCGEYKFCYATKDGLRCVDCAAKAKNAPPPDLITSPSTSRAYCKCADCGDEKLCTSRKGVMRCNDCKAKLPPNWRDEEKPEEKAEEKPEEKP
jgi:hypothetical protein